MDCERLEYVLVQDGRTLGNGMLTARLRVPPPNAEWSFEQIYVSAIDTERV